MTEKTFRECIDDVEAALKALIRHTRPSDLNIDTLGDILAAHIVLQGYARLLTNHYDAPKLNVPRHDAPPTMN